MPILTVYWMSTCNEVYLVIHIEGKTVHSVWFSSSYHNGTDFLVRAITFVSTEGFSNNLAINVNRYETMCRV